VFNLDQLQMCWANRSALAFWNAQSLEELLGRDFSSTASQATLQRLADYRRRLAAGSTIEENWTLFPRGRPYAVHCRITPQLQDDDTLAMLVEVIQASPVDLMPEDLRAVECFRHSALYNLMFAQDGHVLASNPAARELLSAVGEEGDVWTALLADANAAQLRETVLVAGAATAEAPIHTRRGTSWCLVDLRRATDPVTGQTAIVANLHPVDERRRLEQRLAHHRETLMSLLRVAPTPLLISAARDGRMMFANSAARQLFQLPEGESIPETYLTELYPTPSDRERLLQHLRQHGAFGPAEFDLRFPDGMRSMRVAATQVSYEEEAAIVVSLIDIDELKRGERTLNAALVQQRRANDLQRQFVSMVSHEFRTPLSIIDGAAQRILRRSELIDKAELEDRLQTIRGTVAKLSALVGTLLESARAEQGETKFRPESIDLFALVSRCVRTQQEIAPTHRIRLSTTNLGASFYGDPQLLEQIMTNLLSNAVKYSPQGGPVEVSLTERSTRLEITVRDHGVGIPATELPRLFDRFFRASTSAGIAGTGLGLHIVRQFVQCHGGTIRVESQEGEGTSVIVKLPVLHPGSGSVAPKASGVVAVPAVTGLDLPSYAATPR
jgi:signal transduction histidine kinase